MLKNPWLSRGFILALGFSSISLAKPPVTGSKKAPTEMVVTTEQGSELRLDVRQVSLAKVLDSIAQQAKVPIHYSVLPEGVVTATCVGVTLKPVLECLLNRKSDLVVRYGKKLAKANSQDHIVEAWILGSKFETPQNNGMCTASSEQGTIKFNRAESVNQTDEVAENDPTDNLLKIAQSKKAADRAEAIGSLLALGRKNDPKVEAVLEKAVHDSDANVRAQAISTLSHRGENKEAAAAAIQEGLQDSSIDVRLMAVDSITDDIGLLQRAVNDSDETISSLATAKLEALMQKQKNR